ncbi:MAG: hypothetical protein AAB354_08355, partial [candidate division KSB1 bacterium]
MERTIDDVVETLRKAQDLGKKCTLLIGAGCSAKAGIPTAQGFVEIIQRDFPQAYKRALEKTYSQCMMALSPGERRDLIARYVDNAKVNWAHIAIAQLMKHEYIDRVLTTNFDPLLVRACALVGLFPAVYDFAASQLYKAAYIPEQAIFYLHGQRTGFVLMNTMDEFDKHAQLLKPVFDDVATRGRAWLVVGYSGENDPVFSHLANVPQFDYNLFWVGYADSESPLHVTRDLLVEGKYAFLVRGFDADDFFVTLAQNLNCFPPDFVQQPLSHLNNMLNMLTPYTSSLQRQDHVTENILGLARTMTDLQNASDGYGSNRKSPDYFTLQVLFYFGARDYDKVVEIASEFGGVLPNELAKTVAWSYLMQGNQLCNRAKNEIGKEADRLFEEAYDKYAMAFNINANQDEALNNWGIALTDQAKTKSGDVADNLFTRAKEKFQAAVIMNPCKNQALNNWGCTLAIQARTKHNQEAETLYVQATQKFQEALSVNNNDSYALSNWGNTLLWLANQKSAS